MSRPINESIQTLDTTLDTIKEKLSEHLTEGGGMPEQLKVSEIPGYLDQIQSGGGSVEARYIENVQDPKGRPIKAIGNMFYCIADSAEGEDSEINLTVKVKQDCSVYTNAVTNIKVDGSTSEKYLSSGDTVTVTFNDYLIYTALAFTKSLNHYDYPQTDPPDLLIISRGYNPS